MVVLKLQCALEITCAACSHADHSLAAPCPWHSNSLTHLTVPPILIPCAAEPGFLLHKYAPAMIPRQKMANLVKEAVLCSPPFFIMKNDLGGMTTY